MFESNREAEGRATALGRDVQRLITWSSETESGDRDELMWPSGGQRRQLHPPSSRAVGGRGRAEMLQPGERALHPGDPGRVDGACNRQKYAAADQDHVGREL